MTRRRMTQAQLRAATTKHTLTYVKAGPGSGKTYLATESFGYLRLVRHSSDRRGVVGITFARSARRELHDRVRARWGRRVGTWPNSVWTFDELNRQLLRFLVHNNVVVGWPGGQAPASVEDSWASFEKATRSPGKKPRSILTLDDEGTVVERTTRDKKLAPSPVFTKPGDLTEAITAGHCTHNEIRGVLGAAVDQERHPLYNDAIRRFMSLRFCHLLIDEAFDMNPLDCALVERALEAGVAVTLVGDPWQSLYKFRGSSPEQVEELIRRHDKRLGLRFIQIEMPGSHRYESDEMKALSLRLFQGKSFQVPRAQHGISYDIAIAHDWGALWAERRLPVLPAGRPSRMDSGKMACAFTMLLNQVTLRLFHREAAGVGEAARSLNAEPHTADRLGQIVEHLLSREATSDSVWGMLRAAFEPDDKKWKAPGKIAKDAMDRLVSLMNSTDSAIRGITVHQAKGLEWPNVLLLDDLLTTEPGIANVLSIQHDTHRSLYVALTRAKVGVWHADPGETPYGVNREPVEHLPA